ncbi:MAG: hypothetical protein AB7S41_03090 [Parvibaculaceae bacterium]
MAEQADLASRIEAMYRRDVMGAWALVIALWIAILFVLFMTWPLIPVGGVRIAVAIAAAALLIFNTAAIAAMVNHYREDKQFIYGLDIRQLDAMRERGRI